MSARPDAGRVYAPYTMAGVRIIPLPNVALQLLTVPAKNPEGADLLRFVSKSHSLRSVMPIVVSVLCSMRSLVRARAALHLEVLALRHQLLVLERSQRRRVRLTASDRVLWVVLSRVWNGWRTALVLVKPQTVVDWHRRGFRLF